MDIAIVAIYLIGMIAFGFWGKRRATTQSDFLVAGRRLGPMLYSGTMAAIVLGGASTIGGVGLGYEYGISGMWLVFAIGSSDCGSTPSARCSNYVTAQDRRCSPASSCGVTP
jgi:solute:Na+ symporter, SSS family